jgi:16S rRNA (cytidine1402-2'-O)-methyltransferase
MKLFLVPTPIGNLEDITLRAIRVLGEVDAILAEDTRNTGKLLKHLGISKPLYSHHAHNEHAGVLGVIKMLESGKKLALVSDAGTPGISDPGYLLVKACLAKGIEIESLPGATALIPALVNSGFPTDRFIFEGFLPHKKGRQTRFKAMAQEERTIVLYESPHRIIKTLEQIVEFIGPDRQVLVAREITKLHEQMHRGSAEQVLIQFQNHTQTVDFYY